MIFTKVIDTEQAIALFKQNGIENSEQSLRNTMREFEVAKVFVGDSLEYVGLESLCGEHWILIRDGEGFQTHGDLEGDGDDALAVRDPSMFIERFSVVF